MNADEGPPYPSIPDIASRVGEVFCAPKAGVRVAPASSGKRSTNTSLRAKAWDTAAAKRRRARDRYPAWLAMDENRYFAMRKHLGGLAAEQQRRDVRGYDINARKIRLVNTSHRRELTRSRCTLGATKTRYGLELSGAIAIRRVRP